MRPDKHAEAKELARYKHQLDNPGVTFDAEGNPIMPQEPEDQGGNIFSKIGKSIAQRKSPVTEMLRDIYETSFGEGKSSDIIFGSKKGSEQIIERGGVKYRVLGKDATSGKTRIEPVE